MEGVIGYVTMFAGNFAPYTWAFCQGQILNISSNTTLFSILGTNYGGDGRTTFGLPDLRGRVVVGAGNGRGLSPYDVGEEGGSSSVTLTLAQMPAHVHGVNVVIPESGYGDAGDTGLPTGAVFAANGSGYSATTNGTMKAVNLTLNLATVGSDTPYSIMPAYMNMNYVICLQGDFPPRQ